MRRLSITLSFAITAGLPHGQAQNAVASFDDVRSTLETYCVFRHTGKTAAAKVDLTRYDSPDKVVEARSTWSQVVARGTSLFPG